MNDNIQKILQYNQQGMNGAEIAKLMGFSKVYVYKMLKKHKIESPPEETKEIKVEAKEETKTNENELNFNQVKIKTKAIENNQSEDDQEFNPCHIIDHTGKGMRNVAKIMQDFEGFCNEAMQDFQNGIQDSKRSLSSMTDPKEREFMRQSIDNRWIKFADLYIRLLRAETFRNQLLVGATIIKEKSEGLTSLEIKKPETTEKEVEAIKWMLEGWKKSKEEKKEDFVSKNQELIVKNNIDN